MKSTNSDSSSANREEQRKYNSSESSDTGAADNSASDDRALMHDRFIRLLEDARGPLARFCRALCRSANRNSHGGEEQARDLMSETILKAFEHFASLRDPKAFLSFLFTIAIRMHRVERMRQKRWLPFTKRSIETLEETGRAAPDANADIDRLYDALAKLPENIREAIVLSEIMGLKLGEVAEIQRSSLSAVKSRVSRGRKSLQKMLCETSDRTKQTDSTPAGSSSPLRPFDTATSVAGSHRTIQTRFTFETREKL